MFQVPRHIQALHGQVLGIHEAFYYRLMVLMTYVSHLEATLWRNLACISLVLGSHDGMNLGVIKKVAMSRCAHVSMVHIRCTRCENAAEMATSLIQ